jgi:hypothetical protein
MSKRMIYLQIIGAILFILVSREEFVYLCATAEFLPLHRCARL